MPKKYRTKVGVTTGARTAGAWKRKFESKGRMGSKNLAATTQVKISLSKGKEAPLTRLRTWRKSSALRFRTQKFLPVSSSNQIRSIQSQRIIHFLSFWFNIRTEKVRFSCWRGIGSRHATKKEEHQDYWKLTKKPHPILHKMVSVAGFEAVWESWLAILNLFRVNCLLLAFGITMTGMCLRESKFMGLVVD